MASGFMGPRFFQVTVPSVVVCSAVAFHAGAALPDVPAVWTLSMLPFGSVISWLAAKAVEAFHAGTELDGSIQNGKSSLNSGAAVLSVLPMLNQIWFCSWSIG